MLLSRADRALGRLDGSVATMPVPDLLVFMYVLSWTVTATHADLERARPLLIASYENS